MLRFKNDNGKITTVFLDGVFKSFFYIVHDTGQQLTIDRTNFLTDVFLQIIQRTGFVSVNTPHPPKKKEITSWKIGRARGPRHVSETGNGVPGETCFQQWSLTRLQCALWHHLLETTQWHSPFPPPQAYLLSTTHSKDIRFPWFTLYVNFFTLHVSGDYVPIIRRNNWINATLGTCYSVWMTVWYAGAYALVYQTVFVILYGWASGVQGGITSTKCRINTVVSPVDGHIAARNM